VRGQHRELKPIQQLRFFFVWFHSPRPLLIPALI
jgi:hypothetical protein